jgi:hypothetical protein
MLTGVGKVGLRIRVDVALRKLQHEAIDLLRLSRESERLQEESQGVDERNVVKVEHVHKGMHDLDVEVVAEAI